MLQQIYYSKGRKGANPFISFKLFVIILIRVLNLILSIITTRVLINHWVQQQLHTID